MIIYNNQENYHGLDCHILQEDGEKVQVWIRRYAHKKWFSRNEIVTLEEARRRYNSR
jgi:hypothetical protein